MTCNEHEMYNMYSTGSCRSYSDHSGNGTTLVPRKAMKNISRATIARWASQQECGCLDDACVAWRPVPLATRALWWLGEDWFRDPTGRCTPNLPPVHQALQHRSHRNTGFFQSPCSKWSTCLHLGWMKYVQALKHFSIDLIEILDFSKVPAPNGPHAFIWVEWNTSRPFHLIVLWDEAVVAHDINPIQSLGILIFSSVTCSREFDVAVDSMEKKVIVFNTVLVSTDAVFPPWLFPILRVQTFAITHRSGVPSTITSRSDLHFWFSKTSNRSRIALAPRSPTKGGWQKKVCIRQHDCVPVVYKQKKMLCWKLWSQLISTSFY